VTAQCLKSRAICIKSADALQLDHKVQHRVRRDHAVVWPSAASTALTVRKRRRDAQQARASNLHGWHANGRVAGWHANGRVA